MRHRSIVVFLGCCSVLGGCGESAPQPPAVTGEDTTRALTIHTGDFEAPAGDSFECFYTDTTTDKQLNAASATAVQGVGGHHVTVYYIDEPRAPQHHPCSDAEMASWHLVGAAGNDAAGAEGVVSLPPGLALKIPAGKQMVVQAHYVNTTGAVEKVNDSITLHLVPPEEVKAYANFYGVVDDTFEVPAQGTLASQRTCTVKSDLDVVTLLGHMHEAGKHFKLEGSSGEGEPFMTVYDHDWSQEFVSHPPTLRYPMDKPLHFPKGTRLRQTCTWDNHSAEPLIFPNEMCVTGMFYFPDQGALVCPMDPVPPAP
jgi:hypothetical protein